MVRPALVAPGVVSSYTCGFVAQPPGTPGYSHPYRMVAPIIGLRELRAKGMGNSELRRISDDGGVHGLMYVPDVRDDQIDDEWREHAAVLLYRPSLVTQALLDSRPRLARMSVDAVKILGVRLIQVVSPNLFDPLDENLAIPDLSDCWSPKAITRPSGRP